MKFTTLFIVCTGLAQFSTVQSYAQTVPARPGIWATKVESCHLKNLYKLNDSIYRSEQPGKNEFSCLAELGFKSILNLRSHHLDAGLIDDSCLKPFTIKMVAKKFTDNEIIESLRILKYGPKPVVVHCLHGSDRTGVVIAMYRIIFENWTREQALDELQNGGYGFHEQYDNIIKYVEKVDLELIKRGVFN
jgi:tyrosine-protein phosphatase SIW14